MANADYWCNKYDLKIDLGAVKKTKQLKCNAAKSTGYRQATTFKSPAQLLKDKHIRKIQYRKLKDISEHEPLEIFLEISKQFFEFFETFSVKLKTPDRVLEVLIKILTKLCKLSLHETRKYILTKSWLKSEYWEYLNNCVKRRSQQENNMSSKTNVCKSNLHDLMSNIIGYCTFFIWNLNYDQRFVDFLECLSVNYCAGNENRRQTEIGKELEYLKLKANDHLNQKFHYEIYPTIEDLKKSKNHRLNLNPNVVKGQYLDVRHYIELQLALLKEDFIAPLRDGITEWIADSCERIPNLRVYNGVKFNIIQKSEFKEYEDILVDLNVSHNKISKSILNNSNRFMLGSFLCFTTNRNFDDLILAVVTKQNSNTLSKGMIQIDIIKIYNQLGDIFNQTFIMFESEIYFEPYHQVYNILKNLNQDKFPFKNYIIDRNTKFELPDYIPKEDKVYYTYRKQVFDVKDPTSWLKAKSINLDESQLAAFQDALTRKFCMIHGPPGTGKTFIGQQIISTLLENTQLQILIVCRTNHALDRFLMGILSCTDKIVRMGSMSKNTHLDQFNIKSCNDRTNEMMDKRIRTSFYNTRMEYTNFLTEFETLQNELRKPNINVTRKRKINSDILVLQEKMRSASMRLNDLNQIADFNLIKEKRVIGMTSTYAARSRSLLNMIRSPIVLIEEAGELLESHIVATLNEDTQHVIMIGDHQQLRPAISVHHLASEYKMDISLIERMINNGLNCLKLNTQYRQRPEFANLIRPNIYQELIDSESVKKLRNVKGVAKNLFFVNHTNNAARSDDEMFINNKFEAEFIISFCNYLLNQGYTPGDITILTPYVGQMHQLLNLKKKIRLMENVRVSIIDHFQGEENKIILLSLVRSNSDGIIGNLGLENLICVALSRAKEGFYIFGNMNLLRVSSVWREIELKLIQQNAIGNYIPLLCSAHGNIIKVSKSCELNQLKSGNCSGKCGKKIRR